MHGHPQMTFLLHSDSRVRCYRTIRACGIMCRIAHNSGCHGCLCCWTAVRRRWVCAFHHPLLIGTLLAIGVDTPTKSAVVNSHPVNRSVDFRRFCEIALMGLKTHYIGVDATALAQWCTSWSPKLMPLVQAPGIHPKGITYLLADGLLEVRTPT